jgi:CRISPR system Cascade subunit CasD
VTTLLLRLAAPLQSWGVSSRFARRTTEAAPSKSGVIGLLAAAQGRRRTDPIEDLLELRFAVRVDQPGRALRDFQTAHTLDGQKAMPLTQRYYLSDAVFVGGLEGDPELVETLAEAIVRPRFPLYLGRRSCPPTPPLTLLTRGLPLWDALKEERWHAAEWHARQHRDATARLDVLADDGVIPADAVHTVQTVRDAPESFSPERRSYLWRTVSQGSVVVKNPHARTARSLPHDPLSLLEVD